MTIEQTIDIPADHRLHLDMLLPESVPEGRVKIKLSIKPFLKRIKGCNDRTDGIPMGNGMIYYPAPPGYTPGPPDPELAPYIKEAEERAAWERATGENPFKGLKGCMKDSPCFAGRDGVEIQREMRGD
jgi:hypothetical protein